MTTTSSITAAQSSEASLGSTPTRHGLAALGQADFLRMLTAELKQQDPFAPMDQKDMLAQMAQFSSLAGISDTNTALKDIAGKLDQLIAAQKAASPAASA